MSRFLRIALGSGLLIASLSGLGVELPQVSGLPTLGLNPSPTVIEAPELTSLEQQILEQTNAYRQERGLSSLAPSAVITQQARLHSEAMSQQKQLSHDGFEQRVAAIAQSIRYRRAGENVAFNRGYTNPATQAVEGWINSPGHRANLEGDFDLIGIGVTQASDGSYYFTQVFIKQR
ncbi:CAP domain-containing protein [Leptolyngbya sp. AN02str]|uniref:CAP domain-containing protein n=1 Tax=Leptolyngbya sp. AN02str TaxID=3423363 RepID=UPI003D31FF0A